jgi:hypothetical protein
MHEKLRAAASKPFVKRVLLALLAEATIAAGVVWVRRRLMEQRS